MRQLTNRHWYYINTVLANMHSSAPCGPSFGLRVLLLPASVRPSVPKFVRAITHHPFKLGSPNLDQRCKNTLVKVLIFFFFFFLGGGGGNRLWPSRPNLRSKSKFIPFWACPHHNSSPIQAWITKFGPEMQNTLVQIPIVLGSICPWLSR